MSDVLDGDLSPATPAPEAAPTNTAPPTEATTTTEEGASQDANKSDESPDKPYATKEEFEEKLTKRIQREQRRLEREYRERAELMARAMTAERQLEAAQPKQAPEATGEPQLKDFQDYESYTRAIARYEAKQEREQLINELRQEDQQRQQRQVQEQRDKALAPQVQKAIEKYDDYAEVVSSFLMPPAMDDAVAESPHAAEIGYYLGQNHAEVDRIARLSPTQQVREIAKLEARFEAPPKKTTNAPDPVKPVGSGASLTKRIEDMTNAEYKAWRAKNGARIT